MLTINYSLRFYFCEQLLTDSRYDNRRVKFAVITRQQEIIIDHWERFVQTTLILIFFFFSHRTYRFEIPHRVICVVVHRNLRKRYHLFTIKIFAHSIVNAVNSNFLI